MRNEQIISKGVYGFSQVKDFISVSNYIFMHCGEKIALAIRFFNDTEHVFDSVSFYVIQIDALGNVIGKIRVDYTDMNFALIMGAEHAGISKSLIKLSDFRVKIPMLTNFNSLNVSNATAIILFEAVKQKLVLNKKRKGQ